MPNCAHVQLLLGLKEVNKLGLRHSYTFLLCLLPTKFHAFHHGSLPQALSNQCPDILKHWNNSSLQKAKKPYIVHIGAKSLAQNSRCALRMPDPDPICDKKHHLSEHCKRPGVRTTMSLDLHSSLSQVLQLTRGKRPNAR